MRVRASEEDETEGDAPARKAPSTNQMLVFVPPHPLINHWLAIARNVHKWVDGKPIYYDIDATDDPGMFGSRSRGPDVLM